MCQERKDRLSGFLTPEGQDEDGNPGISRTKNLTTHSSNINNFFVTTVETIQNPDVLKFCVQMLKIQNGNFLK